MNETLKLKKLASERSVLFVEDSKALQQRLLAFLNKIFKDVYSAVDGQDGLEVYQEHKPDIVITDLNMPRIDGHEMIRRLKEINPNVQVIIVSAYGDHDNLIKALNQGIVDFIQKPAKLEEFNQALICAIENLNKTDNIDKPLLLSNDENKLSYALEVISQQESEVQLINYYKGVPIVHSADIVEVKNDFIILKTDKIQVSAIENDKTTIIDSILLPSAIKAELLGSKENEINLGNLKYFDFTKGNKDKVFLEPDKNFKLIIHNKKQKKFKTNVLNISNREMFFELEDESKSFNVDDPISINFMYEKSSSKHNDIIQAIQVYCTGKIEQLIEIDKGYKAMAILSLSDKDKEVLGNYIYQREIELIKEFKGKL